MKQTGPLSRRAVPSYLVRSWDGFLVALLSVAFLNILFAALEALVPVTNLLPVFLVIVLGLAIRYGRGPAILASVLEFFAFNYFFVTPRHTLTVALAEEWLALFLFLLTALVTGQLAASQRRQTEEANQREREALVLYELARIMSGTDLGGALQQAADLVRRELEFTAVRVHLTKPVGTTTIAASGDSAALAQLAVTPSDRVLVSPTRERGRWIRVIPPARNGRSEPACQSVTLWSATGQVGSLLFARPDGSRPMRPEEERLLNVAALQLGSAIERAALRQMATEAEILRRTDALRIALLNAVSHDLRTPLTSILAAAGSLRHVDIDWTDQERAEFAEDIEREAARLGRIVNNLLDLSRIEAGTLRPDRAWHDLGTIIEDTIQRIRDQASGHILIADAPGSLPPVFVDAVEIDQVLTNLIENAIKYAPTETEIRVTANIRGDAIEVAVTDQGPGIPPDALSQVFTMYYRVEPIGQRSSGTGIGLAVARGLVEAHGGRIWADNRPEGGARITFSLPAVAPPVGSTR